LALGGVLVTASLAGATARADELTPLEKQWLGAGWPVVDYARHTGLPLDIVVLPKAEPGAAPVSMGFQDGRCLLVLATRGNPDAETELASLDPALRPAIVEAMFAHELGHCWRQSRREWHVWPDGFREPEGAPAATPASATVATAMAEAAAHPSLRAASGPAAASVDEAMALQDQRDARREEAFADLAGLAWTRWRHPAQYERVFDWMHDYRGDDAVPGAPHDTVAWLARARDPRSLDGDASPFDRAYVLWRQGMLAGD
jgi:hypothetical protein